MPDVRRLLTAMLFLGSYGSARGLAFLGPLLLPRLLSAETYGGLELSLSLAALLGSSIGLGVPQAAPRLKLILGQARIADLLALAFLLSALPLLLVSLAVNRIGAPWVAGLTLALAAVYGGQYALSFWARVEGRRFLSTWVDNGTLVLLGAMAAVLLAFGGRLEPHGLTSGFSVVVGILLSGGIAVLIQHRAPGLWAAWRQALREGLPLLATGLVLAGFAAAPRLLAGRFLPLAELGALALAARLCLLLLVVHQLLVTWSFRGLYTWPAERCDRVFAMLLTGLGVLGSLVALVWPWVAPLIAPEFPPLPRMTVALIAGQTIFWIALALFESMLGRQGLGLQAGPILALVGLLFWGAIEALFMVVPATPAKIALVGAGLIATGVATQWLLLRRSGLVLTRAGLALAAAALPPLLAFVIGA